MAGSPALKSIPLRLVESAPFYSKEIELSNEGDGELHSLHQSLAMPDSFAPELPAFFIRKYTRKGDVVLDPFCGSGTCALEAAVSARIPYASDLSPFAARASAAKLNPADITEVTLWLQKLNLRRPINVELYRAQFSSFYDVDTFREICNLRYSLHEAPDRISSFVELIALGLLHGHSAGYLSVYTFPQISLAPQEQEMLNMKRSQSPDYRAVVPRILRKAASALRDGVPSILGTMARQGQVRAADARNLSYIRNAEVDLIVTAPPLPGSRSVSDELWLRHWFAELQPPVLPRFGAEEIAAWREFMNEVLLEAARVVKCGGRAVLDVRRLRTRAGDVLLDEELSTVVEHNLQRFWEVECVLVHRQPGPKLKDSLRERDSAGNSRGEPLGRENRLLVLRRR